MFWHIICVDLVLGIGGYLRERSYGLRFLSAARRL